eukprot:CAMPEP_0171804216 /NCGR_PEP_ID=MMETSP0991-20121206/73949_1 /TAXON_ID=483369 /ORGANISM="non described non described, Strain CCMP2098" /LENGTH=258 /DNA_ID=CAMNT_0012416487 /DNA_START=134 /DNA_END=908 /DNA_ORIENTATION=-
MHVFLVYGFFAYLLALSGSVHGFETFHFLLESAWDNGDEEEEGLSAAFLNAMDTQVHAFETNPIYWLLHESIYVTNLQQQTSCSDWAAQRVHDSFLGKEPPAATSSWDAVGVLALLDGQSGDADNADVRLVPPLYFTGGDGLLARKKDWARPLYELDQLRNTLVPCAALISYDDVYVERCFSEETARLLGDECKVWVTNEYQHGGLRDDGGKVFTTLLAMAKGGGRHPNLVPSAELCAAVAGARSGWVEVLPPAPSAL